MVSRLDTCLLSLAFLVASALPCAGGEIPWNHVEGAKNLTASQRDIAEKVLRTALCYGGCTGTILDGLSTGDPIGVRLANFVMRRAAAGADFQKLMAAIEKRRLSATTPDTMHVDLGELIPSGDTNAPIQVVIYADFDCPYCHDVATALRSASLDPHPGFSLWFKNYPLAQDDRALPAALAYLAAQEQGRGWEMFDGLFAHTGTLTDDALDNIADGAGVDLTRFHADLKSPELAARVRAEKSEAVKCGFDRVPGILVNGKPYLGLKTKVEVLDRIGEERDLLAHVSAGR